MDFGVFFNPLVPTVPHGGTISGGGDFQRAYSFSFADLEEYDTKKKLFISG